MPKGRPKTATTDRISKQVLRVVMKIAAPGPIDAENIRQGLMELSELLKHQAGLKAFVEGPTSQPIQSGLRWMCYVLGSHGARWQKLGPSINQNDLGIPVMVNAVLRQLSDILQDSNLSDAGVLLCSQPWDPSDLYAKPLIPSLLSILQAKELSKVVDNLSPKGGLGPLPGVLSVLSDLAKDDRLAMQLVQLGCIDPAMFHFRQAVQSLTVNSGRRSPSEDMTLWTVKLGLDLFSNLLFHHGKCKKSLVAAGLPHLLVKLASISNSMIRGDKGLFNDDQKMRKWVLGLSAMMAMNWISCDCEAAKKAFAETKVAEELVEAISLPPLGEAEVCGAVDYQRAALMAAFSFAKLPKICTEFVEKGIVQAALKLLTVPPFEAHLRNASPGDEERLVYTTISFVYDLVVVHKSTSMAVHKQLADFHDVFLALSQRKHRDTANSFQSKLEMIMKTVWPDGNPTPDSKTGNDRLCDCVVITPASDYVFDQSRSRGGVMEATRDNQVNEAGGMMPHTKEELEAQATTLREQGKLTEAEAIEKKLKRIVKVEESVDQIQWSEGESIQMVRDGSTRWIGECEGSIQLVLVEYPIGGTRGMNDSNVFPQGTMGYDAVLKSDRFGMVTLPRSLARRLKEAKDQKMESGKLRPDIVNPADRKCAQCSFQSKDLLRCALCKKVRYCNAECQKLHWKAEHKYSCEGKKK